MFSQFKEIAKMQSGELGGAMSSTALRGGNLLGGDFLDVSQSPTRASSPESVNTDTIMNTIGVELSLMRTSVRQLEEKMVEIAEERDRAKTDLSQLQERYNILEESANRSRSIEGSSRRDIADAFEATRQRESRTMKWGRKPVIKTADIKEVNIKELSGFSSRYVLEDLFNRVQACAEDDDDRIAIAETKLGRDARSILGVEKGGKDLTWEEFKQLSYQVFKAEKDTVSVIQDINASFHYDMEMEPMHFVNEMKAVLGSIKASDMPNVNSMIKRKLFNGIPKGMQETLQPYMDDNTIKVVDFVRSLTKCRASHMELKKGLGNVRELTEVTIPVAPESRDEIKELLAEVRKTNETIVRVMTTNRRRYPPSCGYCNWDTSHLPATCPKNPPPGSCYDCLQVGHKRKDSTCPKRQ